MASYELTLQRDRAAESASFDPLFIPTINYLSCLFGASSSNKREGLLSVPTFLFAQHAALYLLPRLYIALSEQSIDSLTCKIVNTSFTDRSRSRRIWRPQAPCQFSYLQACNPRQKLNHTHGGQQETWRCHHRLRQTR